MIQLLQHYLLTILIFLPTVGAMAVLIVRHPGVIRWIALGTGLAVFLLSLLPAVPVIYEWRAPGAYAVGGVVQLVQRTGWIDSIGAQYFVGLDGLSFPLLVLTAILFLLSCGAAWKAPRPLGFFTLILLLETVTMGSLLSLDFLLFFVFAAAAPVLMFILLGWWGNSRRVSGGFKLLLWSVISLGAMFVVMLEVNRHGGSWDLIKLANPHARHAAGEAANWLFAAAFVACAIRMPLVPFHIWAEKTFAETPIELGMVLAGAGSVVGYGMFRIAWALFPEAAVGLRPLIVLVGILSMGYGAVRAATRRRLKHLIADLSIVQMGLVILAMATGTEHGVEAAMFLLCAQALVIAALMVVAGILERRVGHDQIDLLGGLAEQMRGFSGLSLVVFLGAMGLPGLCLFVGQFLALLGIFAGGSGWAHVGWRVVGLVACGSILLTAAASLGAYGKIFFGAARVERAAVADLDQREMSLLIPLVILIVLLGILPWILFFAVTQQTAGAIFSGFF
jgi:NADH-quinone oxidoreductase subunit M